ncbi:MAG TPA: class I SAM-dependent methyltransferase [Ktedonobacteraceae bacterium]|nr:class I SAM-dependent methyltransferase [Ktedonobacteraceae bacterium]
MTDSWTPEKGIIEFFDKVYSQYEHYWQRPPNHYSKPWVMLLEALSNRQPGLALDLGSGEGIDAIRLARLGYQVDAVEGSAVGAEKTERFAREAGVRVNVMHMDAQDFQPSRQYDLIICNGLLHYVENKALILQRMQQATKPGGYNMVFLFSNYNPVPECHRIINVYCDKEDGITSSFYRDWQHTLFLEHNKQDHAHTDFPPHQHSMIKIVAKKSDGLHL